MAKKRKKRKPRPLSDEFLQWVAKYNVWRKPLGYPIMVPTNGLEGLYYCVVRSAEAHEETWPTWEELTAGAKHGPIGTGFEMHSAIWMLLPKGERGECDKVDKNMLKMARWGRKTETGTRLFSEMKEEMRE